jgi:hypothetical protein
MCNFKEIDSDMSDAKDTCGSSTIQIFACFYEIRPSSPQARVQHHGYDPVQRIWRLNELKATSTPSFWTSRPNRTKFIPFV